MTSSNTITVTTQDELDKALTDHRWDDTVTILIKAPWHSPVTVKLSTAGELIVDAGGRVRSVLDGGLVDSVRDGGLVDSVLDGGRVRSVRAGGRVDSVRAGGRVDSVLDGGRVRSVRAGGRVDSVRAGGRVDSVLDGGRVDSVLDGGRVRSVLDGGRVRSAAGTSIIHLYAGATLTRAGSHTAVYLHDAKVTVTGGHLIDVTDINQRDAAAWCAYHAVHVDDEGLAHLYKAVDDTLHAGHDHYLTQYPLGELVTDPRWRDDHECGGGLHVCPTPVMARDHYLAATRFLEITVSVNDLRPIDSTKCKAPAVTVLREVTLDGDPIEAA
ncbi:DUF7666 domain-containing protein [Salana multivorans]|uniref:DUF7666 domain-containing protein n=1 Tax=Salana multivorans TaxID=120377 RepID=UPI0024918A70|nr:hypothetical protein [Salana multivorans]